MAIGKKKAKRPVPKAMTALQITANEATRLIRALRKDGKLSFDFRMNPLGFDIRLPKD